MRFIFKLIGFALTVALVAAVGLGVYGFLHRGELVENAIVEATGNTELADIGGKIANGENLSDAELQRLLGVDSATFDDIKESAAGLGIDVNDGAELNGIITKNMDKLDDVRAIAERVQAGKLTSDQAIDQLSKILELS